MYPPNGIKKLLSPSNLSLLFVVLVFCKLTVGYATEITSVRHWVGPNWTRLVFDTSDEVKHELFKLTSPDRIVIDFSNTRLTQAFPELVLGNSQIRSIRSARRSEDDFRIVLDLGRAAQVNSFLLKPNPQYGYRLVVDITNVDKTTTSTKTKSIKNVEKGLRPVIVAIDAGHGGEDPGAIGPRGVREKDVVLAIANSLYDLLTKEPGISPIMVRDGDYYVGLRDRINVAREGRADLFISIHADAVRNRKARGASVYVLSQKSASSEAARWLADSQNDSDLIGGVVLDDKDDLLASVLLDLTQNATLAASTELAQGVIRALGKVGRVHNRDVEKAGFVVLKSPDIPSILVEIGFISNVSEEQQLRDSQYQKEIAKSVLAGIRGYFAYNVLPGTLFASTHQMHRIQRGETLNMLAQRYQVSLQKLRNFNSLLSDNIKVGEILRIPRIHGG